MRFGRCDLRCAWCDSPGTWLAAERCRVEEVPGSGHFREILNPVSSHVLLAAVDALRPPIHRFASLTGGEPLLQPDAIAALAPALRERGLRTHLETHGLATAAMRRVAAQIDVVSMDWKLASDVRRESDPRGERAADFHDQHAAFLEAALAAGEVIVKVVVTPSTQEAELDALAARMAALAPQAPLVLQPVTPFARVRERPPVERVLHWQQRLSESLADVRVIPQTHRGWGAP